MTTNELSEREKDALNMIAKMRGFDNFLALEKCENDNGRTGHGFFSVMDARNLVHFMNFIASQNERNKIEQAITSNTFKSAGNFAESQTFEEWDRKEKEDDAFYVPETILGWQEGTIPIAKQSVEKVLAVITDQRKKAWLASEKATRRKVLDEKWKADCEDAVERAKASQLQTDIEKLEGLKGIAQYGDGDGNEVKSFTCNFCETYQDRFKGASEETIKTITDEFDEHFKNDGCKCYQCMGYSRSILMSKDKAIQAIKEDAKEE